MLEFLKTAVAATKRKREQDEVLSTGQQSVKRRRIDAGGDGPEWFFPCCTAAPLFNGPDFAAPKLTIDTTIPLEDNYVGDGEEWQECVDQTSTKKETSKKLSAAVDAYLQECMASNGRGTGGDAKKRKRKRRKKKQKKNKTTKESKERSGKLEKQQARKKSKKGNQALASGSLDDNKGKSIERHGEALDKDLTDEPGTSWEIAETRPIRDTVSYGEMITDDDPLRPKEAPLKYWVQRFRFFSRYDEGIRMDREGWFSVTPEEIARHIAERCACDLIVDAFCGVGGNTIQFAMTCNRVIAIDNDEERLLCAKHNAKVYGVEDRIDFILGDYFDVIKNIRADAVFLSPPWGGPDYVGSNVFDVHDMGGMDGVKVMQYAQLASHNIAYFLPRNVDSVQVLQLAPDRRCEVEGNFLNAKLKTVTAYYGDLIQEGGEAGDVEEDE